jgi:hypothetical protein
MSLDPPGEPPAKDRRVVDVPLAKPVGIVLSTLAGAAVGYAVPGLNPFLGSLLAAILYSCFESLPYFRPSRFQQLRQLRRRRSLQARAATSPTTAVLTSFLVNMTLAAIVLGALALTLALVTVHPSDLGLSEGEVSHRRIYLTLGAVGFGIAASVIALFWGAAADLAEGKVRRGLLGLAALAAEFAVAVLLRNGIEGPDNAYTTGFSIATLWAACFLWDPLRWYRAYKYGKDSRLWGLFDDIRNATAEVLAVERPVPGLDANEGDRADMRGPGPPPSGS